MSLRPLPADDLEHVLAHTRPLWENLRGQRIFITGGTGFFGMWLLETFTHANTALNLGAEAVVLTRDSAAFARKAPHLAGRADLTFVTGDVGNFTFPAGDFTHVIHAATTSGSPVSPEEMTTTILDGTRRVLEFAAQAHSRRLLYISSGAVYGPQPAHLERIPEDYVGQPTDAYGRGKKAAEQLCLDTWQAGGPEPVIARCFAFVGPHLPLDAHFAVGNFIRDVLAGGPIRIGGDGTPLRSYLHTADLAVWLWTILVSGMPGRAYNVGSDQPVSIAELARAVAALRTPAPSVEIARIPTPGQLPARYVPDTSGATTELTLKIHLPLASALQRTYAWLRTTSHH
jgi:nucleoside-diphosphate-sugar epimerase